MIEVRPIPARDSVYLEQFVREIVRIIARSYCAVSPHSGRRFVRAGGPPVPRGITWSGSMPRGR